MRRHLKTSKPTYSNHSWRFKVWWFFILFFGGIIIIRLFWLQVIQHKDFEHLADLQHQAYQELAPERGSIYAQDTRKSLNDPNRLLPVATNQSFYLVYAQTYAITNVEETAKKLNEVLALPATVLARVTTQLAKDNDPYEPLAHRVTEDKINAIAALNLPGIKWEKEKLRYYPGGPLGSNLLGFVGWVSDELKGQYGLEGFFEDKLKGSAGYLRSEQDAQGRLIGVGDQNYKKPVNGADLILTIDKSIQDFSCAKLDEAVKKYDATGGSIIVEDPATGKILAMCGNPDYNPNAYNEVENIRAYTNGAIFNAYEPGSVFKVITMAAAMDQEKVTPDTTYEDTGEEKIGSFTIRNADLKSHGTQTMTEVLKSSLNTGAIFAMRQIGAATFQDYVKKFGFGELTNITLEGEVAGTISSLNKSGDIYAATASFGQGIMVTPLQMINSYAVIANGGKLMRPYVVEEVREASGQIYKTVPQEVRQVISQRTATLVSGMMVRVVEDTTGHTLKAQVSGYHLAGKTGTAQVVDQGSGGYGNRTIHTFIGFGPVADPAFVILVRLDHPTATRFAEGTSVPIFAEIAKFILNYYQIKSDGAK